jgi:hypothetical protein
MAVGGRVGPARQGTHLQCWWHAHMHHITLTSLGQPQFREGVGRLHSTPSQLHTTHTHVAVTTMPRKRAADSTRVVFAVHSLRRAANCQMPAGAPNLHTVGFKGTYGGCLGTSCQCRVVPGPACCLLVAGQPCQWPSATANTADHSSNNQLPCGFSHPPITMNRGPPLHCIPPCPKAVPRLRL